MFNWFKKKKPPEGFLPVSGMQIDFVTGKASMVVEHEYVVYFAEEMAKYFKNAKGVNYVSVQCWHKGTGPLEIIVQRSEGKTPAQINLELKEEIARLRGERCVYCPKCGEPDPVLYCENCGHNWEVE